jgi:hypothetical protein
LLRLPVRRNTRWFRPLAARSPPELHPPSGFPSHTVRATFIAPPTTAFHGPRRIASVQPDLLLRACLPRPRFPACNSATTCRPPGFARALRRIATVARCRRGVTASPATSHGVTCASECCKRRRTELSGLPGPAMASSFPNRLRGIPTVSVCQSLARSAHPLVRFVAPPESLEPPPVPALMSGTPSRGFRPSSRCQSAESTLAGIPSPLRSAHDVSHVLDGLLLHKPSRVYFTPQPRPGFALQGFSLARSRTGSSPAVALMSFTHRPCSRFPDSARATSSPSGPCSACQSVAARDGLGRVLLDPLLSFSSFGFSFAHRESDLHRSSDHGLSRPSSCCQRAT